MGRPRWNGRLLDVTAGTVLRQGYLPNAWTVNTDSKWLYDWENDQATIPLNLTIRKVTRLGKLPLKLELGFDYFVESDDRFGQDWAVTLNFSPVVPNFIYDAFN